MKALAKTDIGRAREINQDSYYMSTDDDNLKLYIIADGMGGYSGGEVASNLAVLTVKKYIEKNVINDNIKNNEEIFEILRGAIKAAHFAICEKSQKDKNLEEMGTTLDICLIYNSNIYVGHIGDSRVYRIDYKKEIIEQLTVDHSYVQNLLKEGTITKEEAYNHPKKNMLMKALGGKYEFEPDVFLVKKEPDDSILMCTDGLTNMLRDNEIFDIIFKDKNVAIRNLIQAANENGGLDNITVILIDTKILGNEE